MDRETFAKRIKQKYPQYATMDNNELVDKITTKYPEYKNQIKDSFVDRVSNVISESGDTVNRAISGEGEFEDRSVLGRGVGAAAAGANAISSVGYEALPERVRGAFDAIGGGIGKGFELITDKIADSKLFREAVGSQVVQPDGTVTFVENEEGVKKLEDALKIAADLGIISGEVLGARETAALGNKIVTKTTQGASAIGTKIGDTASDFGRKTGQIAEDVIPTRERMVEFQVTRALDLTQGDVKNISKATGNEVGDFLADKNLIRETKAATQNAVDDFFNDNFNQVRNNISKVDRSYRLNDIPRGEQALNALKKQVSDVVGLEDVADEVSTLLKKKNLQLNDVQRIKELIDDQFNLFKVTGDVKDSVTKEGLANVRNDIKKFIENEVKDAIDIDIAPLNNNVATAKSISNAVAERSTRGLTRSTLKLGDLGVFGLGSAVGGPLTGAALVVGKKIVESAPIRLRIAKWLDGLNDARKAKVISDLEAGKVPQELQKIVDSVEVTQD